MNRLAVSALILFVVTADLKAQDLGTLIFEDRFERRETDETVDAPGNGWTTNSARRAKGNKQVDLRDGALHIYIHEAADHAVSVVHAAEFQNGAVQARFKLEHPKDSFTLNFADPTCKEVHAGHLFKVTFKPKSVVLQDLKTGTMRLDLRTARKAGKKPDPETVEMLKSKVKMFQQDVPINKWHELLIQVVGPQLKVTLNGNQVGSFSSPGIAHPTKKLLRLSVPRQAVVDDLKVYRADVPVAKKEDSSTKQNPDKSER